MFLPFELAVTILQQVSGVSVSDSTLWNWVQAFGRQAKTQLESQLEDFSHDKRIQVEARDSMLEAMPLIIAADGVTVPFRPQPKTSKGKIVWREIRRCTLDSIG